jgi:hypothetical protein
MHAAFAPVVAVAGHVRAVAGRGRSWRVHAERPFVVEKKSASPALPGVPSVGGRPVAAKPCRVSVKVMGIINGPW